MAALLAGATARARLARPHVLWSHGFSKLPPRMAAYHQAQPSSSWLQPASTASQMAAANRTARPPPDAIPARQDKKSQNAQLPAEDAIPAFVPRKSFAASDSIIRSYYLGHHHSALQSMVRMLNDIDVVIECRDVRVPVTSTNPKLEQALAGKERVVVYTKADLLVEDLDRDIATTLSKRKEIKTLLAFHAGRIAEAVDHGERAADALEFETANPLDERVEDLAQPTGSGPSPTIVFVNTYKANTTGNVIKLLKARAAAHDSLIGIRALVVGMPNAGKSSLLNALRSKGTKKKGTVSRTGDEPGVTRQVQTPVRVTEDDGDIPAVQVYDTPGVFVPYVADVESMLKLSLVGCVKDGIVPVETIADYLLFRLNLHDPGLYSRWSAPTNSVEDFLDNVGRKRGMLGAGGEPSRLRAADWIVQQWRKGKLGRFCLDDLSEDNLRRLAHKLKLEAGHGGPVSLRQAKKLYKDQRKANQAARHAART